MSLAADNLAKLAAMFREGTTPHQLAVDALAALEARAPWTCKQCGAKSDGQAWVCLKCGTSTATAPQDAPCASVEPRGSVGAGEAATYSPPVPVWVAQASEIRSAKKKRKQVL